MSILKVLKFPDPILKKTSSKVTVFNKELEHFISNLMETIQAHEFCIGLAAPQVGNLQRIIIIDVSRARKPSPNSGLLILINPIVTEVQDYKIVREGCLSIPDFTANVKRAMKIKVTFQNIAGEIKDLETKDLEAHAIQHEIDHLDGILFLDKITNPATDLFRRKIRE